MIADAGNESAHAVDLGLRSDRIAAKEAAELLGVSLGTLYRAVRAGTVAHWRVGRVCRFSKRQLLQLTGELREDAATVSRRATEASRSA